MLFVLISKCTQVTFTLEIGSHGISNRKCGKFKGAAPPLETCVGPGTGAGAPCPSRAEAKAYPLCSSALWLHFVKRSIYFGQNIYIIYFWSRYNPQYIVRLKKITDHAPSIKMKNIFHRPQKISKRCNLWAQKMQDIRRYAAIQLLGPEIVRILQFLGPKTEDMLQFFRIEIAIILMRSSIYLILILLREYYLNNI